MVITMPSELDEHWSAVERARAKRQAVRARVDELAEEMGTARRRLANADNPGDRDAARTQLASLQAEAGTMPDEVEGTCDVFAQALAEWAINGLGLAESIERAGRNKASDIYAEERDLLTELAAAEEGNATSGPISYVDHNGEPRTVRPRRDLKDPATIRISAAGRAESAEKAAGKEAKPIRRLVQVTCKVGRSASIFGGNAGAQRVKDRPFSDHSGWLKAERAEAERVLAEAR